MKRKAASRSRVKRAVKPNSSRMQTPWTFRRVVIVTSSLFVLAAFILVPARHQMGQAVAGASVLNTALFNKATIRLPSLKSAVKYNIYYGETSQGNFPNAVRNLPSTTVEYTILYLKKHVNYQYRMSSVSSSGKEDWFSTVMPLTNVVGM